MEVIHKKRDFYLAKEICKEDSKRKSSWQMQNNGHSDESKGEVHQGRWSW